MINAIQKNKVPKVHFKMNEDSFTSLVFERLLYLGGNVIGRILGNAVLGELPDINWQEIIDVSFWPHWNSTGTNNQNFVEPDVFIRFPQHDIIIEAKRYDTNQQSHEQWRNEIKAYLNEYITDNKQLIFVALGGINNYKNEVITVNKNQFNILKCKWVDILESIKIENKKLRNRNKNYHYKEQAILSDLIVVFQIYGFYTSDWFEFFETETGITSQGIKSLSQNPFNND